MLESKKQALIKNVEQQFDAKGSLKDLAILYEITGFQGQIPDDLNAFDFWDNYADFKNSSSRQFDDLLQGINDSKVSLNVTGNGSGI